MNSTLFWLAPFAPGARRQGRHLRFERGFDPLPRLGDGNAGGADPRIRHERVAVGGGGSPAEARGGGLSGSRHRLPRTRSEREAPRPERLWRGDGRGRGAPPRSSRNREGACRRLLHGRLRRRQGAGAPSGKASLLRDRRLGVVPRGRLCASPISPDRTSRIRSRRTGDFKLMLRKFEANRVPPVSEEQIEARNARMMEGNDPKALAAVMRGWATFAVPEESLRANTVPALAHRRKRRSHQAENRPSERSDERPRSGGASKARITERSPIRASSRKSFIFLIGNKTERSNHIDSPGGCYVKNVAGPCISTSAPASKILVSHRESKSGG